MKGSFYILAAIFLWSSLGVIVRLSGAPVHVLIFYSALISVAILGVAFCTPVQRAKIKPGRKYLYLLILGPITLLNVATFFYAFKHTTIANAMMTHYIAPVVVALLAPVFLKEKITKRVVVAIVIASAGLWVLLGASPGSVFEAFSNPQGDTPGIIAGLISGLAYGVSIVLMRVFALRFAPAVMCLLQNIMICLMLAPFVGAVPEGALWSVILMGTVHSTLAPILYFKGMSMVTAGRAAVLSYIEPPSAIIFSMLVLSEFPSAVSAAGGALILFAGYITIRDG